MKLSEVNLALVFGMSIGGSFYLANNGFNPIFSVFGLLLLIFSCLYTRGASNFLLFLFLVPSQRIITFPDSSISLINILIFLAVCLFLFKQKTINLGVGALYLWLCPAMYAGLSYIISNSLYDTAVGVKLFFLLIYIWHFASIKKYDISFPMVGKVYVAGCIFACILAIFDYNFGQRLSGGDNSDANILAAYISFALACLVVLFISGRSSLMLSVIGAGALVFFGLLTQSRSFLLCLAIIVTLSVIELLLNSKSRIKGVALTISFTLVIAILSGFFVSHYQNLVNPVMDRLFNAREGDISGGRLMLWEVYIEYLFSSYRVFFFGIGSENAMDAVGTEQVAHNAILETAVGWGVIGTILVFTVLVNFSRKIYLKQFNPRNSQMKIIGLLPMLTLTAASFTGHSILSIGFVVSLLISVLAYSLGQKSKSLK